MQDYSAFFSVEEKTITNPKAHDITNTTIVTKFKENFYFESVSIELGSIIATWN